MDAQERRLVREAMLEFGAVGALAGGVVTGLFWSWIGSWWLVAALIGAVLGIPLAIVVGAGVVKEAWSGFIAAFVVTAATIAFVNVAVFVVLVGSHSH